jgi:hypothetical protein
VIHRLPAPKEGGLPYKKKGAEIVLLSMYETRGYPVDVIVRDRQARERAQRRASRLAALRSAVRARTLTVFRAFR